MHRYTIRVILSDMQQEQKVQKNIRFDTETIKRIEEVQKRFRRDTFGDTVRFIVAESLDGVAMGEKRGSA